MSKINFYFNGADYSIDESAVSSAASGLKTHLSTVINGSGAVINLGDTVYNVDSAKLAATTNGFISHLSTIAGQGYKVIVNGVEYSIGSDKISGAISSLESAFENLSSVTPDAPEEDEITFTLDESVLDEAVLA